MSLQSNAFIFGDRCSNDSIVLYRKVCAKMAKLFRLSHQCWEGATERDHCGA